MSNKVDATTMQQTVKRELMPKLRFPEFRNAGKWKIKELADLIRTVTPPKKIPSTLFSESGSFPIIDQSQTYISGWTDDQDAVISNGLPLIIFGDHTCVLKITDVPFVQGADGIKIFGSSPGLSTTFLYQQLLFNPVKMEEYKRHFATLKNKIIAFPEESSGEQQKIADCLSSVDEMVAAQAQVLARLKAHKKGLMQRLFPAEGETLPKLRFPEFRDAGEWEIKQIGQVSINVTTGGTPSTSVKEYWGGGIRWMNSGELNYKKVYEVHGRITEEGMRNSSTKLIPKMCVLIGLAGQGKTRGTVAMNMIELCINQSIAAIFPNEKSFSSDFLYHNLDNRYDELRSLSTGGEGRGGLNLPIIKTLKVPFPKPKEQQKIADCLSSIDEIVAAQAQKLARLKAHKKGLMQQLFPSLGQVNT